MATAFKPKQTMNLGGHAGTRCSPHPCEALADALTINRTICSISLPYNYFGDEGCKAPAVPTRFCNCRNSVVCLRPSQVH